MRRGLAALGSLALLLGGCAGGSSGEAAPAAPAAGTAPATSDAPPGTGDKIAATAGTEAAPADEASGAGTAPEGTERTEPAPSDGDAEPAESASTASTASTTATVADGESAEPGATTSTAASTAVTSTGEEAEPPASTTTPDPTISTDEIVTTTTSVTDPPETKSTAPAATTTTTTVPPAVPRPEASTVDGLLALDRPLVIAHAGGDQDYPHSTMYAYTMSVAAGADVLELDVQLTADGSLIVQHDDTVDRTTETTGPVADLTLAEIQALDNAHWFVPGLWGDQSRPAAEYVFRGVRGGSVEPPPGFGAEDFRVATFREVAERFPHHVLDLEIKLQRGPDGEEDPRSGIAAAEVLAAEIAELGRQDSVIVACFDDVVLAAFQQLAPEVATTPGTDELVAWWLAGETLPPRYRVVQVPFTYSGIEVVQPDLVDRVHDEGLEVWVWLSGTDVLEEREFYAELIRRGVDGLIAGRPAEAVAALAEAP